MVTAILVVEYFIIFYVGALNTIYFFLTILAFFTLRNYRLRLNRAERLTLMKSPLVPPVAILAPAYNEAATCRESVRAMLNLHYPRHEVIVINDGSTDDTLSLLIDEFRLYRSARLPSGQIETKPIKAVYQSRDPIRLVVVDKENGGKADALNAGLNVARAPWVAAVDSDSLLEEDSLLYIATPFLDDPDRMLAAGGIIRVVNGCEVRHGRVERVSAPSSLIGKFQVVEYLRAFLGGRVAFSFMNSLLVISGAFGLFRREAVGEAGGFTPSTVGEDMELVTRLHHVWRRKGDDYRIAFVPDPVCWTEVPESWSTLHRQRNRWQRGTVESLWMHRKMFLNPRMGVLGLFVFPYFVLFEMLGPVVELAGYVYALTGLAFGFAPPHVVLVFFLVSVGYGMLLSVGALILEEFTVKRYPSVRDVLTLLWVCVVENIGYRQLMTVWRARGLIDGIRGKKGWGTMVRRGFAATPRNTSG